MPRLSSVLLVGLVVLVSAALLAAPAEAKLKEKECEVCISVIKKVEAILKEKNIDVKNEEKVESTIRKYCKTAKKKENRFCYYIGGTEDAATGILRFISGPLGRYLPAEKICEQLKKKDGQICELQYDVPLDISKIDLKKQRVKALKKILNEEFDDACKGCVEKQDFINRINTLKKARDEL